MSERRERRPRAAEQRSESGGGGLLGPVLTLVGIPVGWFVSTVAALFALTYLISSDTPTLIAGIGPQTTFYASIGVLVVVGFIMLLRPGTVFFGWLLMDIIVAGAATFFLGWSTVILFLEGLSLIYIVPAHFFQLVEEAPDGFMAALALDRRLR